MRPIEEILKNPDLNEVVRLLTMSKPAFAESVDEVESQWNEHQHRVMDVTKRKKKVVKVATGEKDHKTGEPVYKEKKVERCRICIPMQKLLVRRGVGFLFSNPVHYAMTQGSSDAQKRLYNSVMSTFKVNKIRYKDKDIAQTLMREREVAELWYFELDSKGKPQNIRMKILRPSEGNKLYPHFDDWGNMDGFARKFKTRDENGDTTTHFDIYTRELVYRLIENGGDYVQQHQPARHGFTKVPVIYYRQEHAEWHDVQIAIERVEELLSNWGDTNDYFGTPAYFFKGKLKGFAEKGEQGKVYQGEGDCDMRVLSWDNSPESVRNELATLLNIIYSFSQIPDISFETMKQLGNNTSGVAIQLMFTDPHMHAENKIQMYGEMFQRRYNLVQNGIATSITTISDREVAEIEVEPKFEPYMPKNLLETIQLLNLSTGNKPTMSQQEAVKQNPLVDNAAEVQQQLDSEAQAQQTASMLQDLYGIANS